MRIETFALGVFQVNTYLLFCEKTGACVVVDPGERPDVVVTRLEELGSTPVAILNTHGHLDHVAGNGPLKTRFDIPILMHPEDRFLVDGFSVQAAQFGLDLPAPPPPDGDLVPGEAFTFGEVRLDVKPAPGQVQNPVVKEQVEPDTGILSGETRKPIHERVPKCDV